MQNKKAAEETHNLSNGRARLSTVARQMTGNNKAAREGQDAGALHDDAVAALCRRSVWVFAFADGTPD
jgi:hypothetical protein